MVPALDAARARWRRLVGLAAPVWAHSVARNLMRTTDVLIAASLSPAAVAGLAVADLYRQLLGRVGGGLGGGAVALASQDHGADADANRDEAVVQAALLSVLVAVPFAVGAVLFGRELVALVGAGPDAARQGGAYLAVTMAVAPLTLPKATFAQAFSAVGDTRTPTAVGVSADALNVVGSLALALGVPWLGVPALGVLGLGIATAAAASLSTVAYVVLLARRSPYTFVVPADPTVARQLLRVGAPQAASGFVTSAAVFPFSRLLLGFGTAVYAGYEVAWRLFTQTFGSINPGLAVATKVLVGQRVGDDDHGGAREVVRAALALSAVLVGALAVTTFLAAPHLVGPFVDGAAARDSAVLFVRVLAAVAVVGSANNVLSGALQGASETRVPLLSRIAGMGGGMVATSWLLGVGLGWGVAGAVVGQVATYGLFVAVTAWGYLRTDWAGRATAMMDERGSREASEP